MNKENLTEEKITEERVEQKTHTPTSNLPQCNAFTFFKNIKNLSGRASRKEFWYFVIFTALLNPLLMIFFTLAAVVSKTLELSHVLQITAGLLVISGILIMLASVRRLHDTDRSAWYLLLNLLPLLGSLTLLVLCCFPSQQTGNRYGQTPGEDKREGLFASLSGFLLLAFSLLLYTAGAVVIFLTIFMQSIIANWSWDTPCSQTDRLKNLGIAIAAYQQQNNHYLPDKNGLEGLQQLKTAQKDLAIDFNCKNGAQFAYVGNGLSYPTGSVPTIICISKAHPYHIHYVNANGEVKCLEVKKHPENFSQAAEAILINSDPTMTHVLTFGLSLLALGLDKQTIMKNAYYIDNPQLLNKPENQEKTSPAAETAVKTSPEQ